MWGIYPSFEKKYFPFSYVAPFDYDSAPNEGIVKFSFSLPKKGGRGDKSKHRILKLRHTPNCLQNTYELSVRWF